MSRPTPRRHRQFGLTLIELMIAVAIVALLATLALPSYERYRQRTIRADAVGCLLTVQRRMEGFFIRNDQYTATLSDLSVDSSCSERGQYQIAIAGATAACPLRSCYEVTATPGATGQVDDGVLRLRYDLAQSGVDGGYTRTRIVDGETKSW